MASNNTPSPLHLSTQELKNAAAGVVSEQASLPRPLRSSQSFRLDEGYSGEETPIVYDETSGQDLRAVREGVDFKIPPWMAGLNDALREEYAYKLIRTLPTSRIASLVDRLVPILYLDFVQMLPPELSLQILSYLPVRSLLNASLASRTWRRFALEPRLWKDLYEVQGWRCNESEVLRLEDQLREEPEDCMRQQMDVKRKAEDQKDEEKNLRDIARRNSERFRNSAERSGVGTSSGSNSPVAMDTAQEWPSQTTTSTEVDMNNITQSTEGLDMSFYSNASLNSGLRPGGGGASFTPGPTVPDEEIFSTCPGAPKTSIPQTTYQELPLPVEPTLTVPGYGSLRINWAFIFKYRKRLEDNWIHNRYTTFQIPHPDFPTEGHAECIYTIQYSPNYLVSGSRDRTVRVWDMKTRRLRGKPLEGHNGSVLCLQFDESPDEDILITGSSDDSVIIWRFSTGEKIRTIKKAHQESVLNLKFSKKWLVTCSKDKFIKVWNRQQLETTDQDYPWHSKLLFGNSQAARSHPHHPGSRQAQASRVVRDPAVGSGSGLRNPYADSGFVAAGGPPKVALPKTLPPYTTVQVLTGHAAAVNAIQLHGDQIASASGDRLIKLWNLRTGACEKTYVGHTKGIACIQFDGHTIVSGSSDQTIRVFDGRTQAEIATLSGHRALVRTVQATENRIVSGSYDETVRIWRKDIDGQWTDSHVLRQGGPENHHPRPAHHAIHPVMPGNLQQGTIPQTPIPQAAIQMHQVHTVGPALAGAVVAAQLLPNHHHHIHHPPQPPPPPPPQPQAQQQQMPPAHPIPTTSGTHRVFKLQFDARWIICCSQDSKIIGWDYAAGDPGIIEASRFFEGGN